MVSVSPSGSKGKARKLCGPFEGFWHGFGGPFPVPQVVGRPRSLGRMNKWGWSFGSLVGLGVLGGDFESGGRQKQSVQMVLVHVDSRCAGNPDKHFTNLQAGL